jgi:hypothetical protein
VDAGGRRAGSGRCHEHYIQADPDEVHQVDPDGDDRERAALVDHAVARVRGCETGRQVTQRSERRRRGHEARGSVAPSLVVLMLTVLAPALLLAQGQGLDPAQILKPLGDSWHAWGRCAIR